MVRYRCDECKGIFEEPYRVSYSSSEYGDSTECSCPHCGSDCYTEVEECPGCDGWKNSGEHVCISCRLYARRLLARTAKMVSEVIREEMDEILNTESMQELADEI